MSFSIFSILLLFFVDLLVIILEFFATVKESKVLFDQRVLIEMAAPGSVTLDQLTLRHGIKVVIAERCSVEDCSLAVAQVVGLEVFCQQSRMNSTIVLFLDDVNKVNEIVAGGMVINEAFTAVMPFVATSEKDLSVNVPPYIKDKVIERELARHGKVVSKIKRLALNCKSVQLKHVVTFRDKCI